MDLGGLGGVLGGAAGFLLGGPAGAALGAGIGGGIDTNSANAAVHSNDNAFNAQQADVNRVWSADQAQKAMDFSASQAEENREFQRQSQWESERYDTDMANTSYQRGVKDMEAAGLSPMLAYMKGGASAPTVAPQSGSVGSSSMGQSSAASAASPISMQNVIAAGLNSANVSADTANKLATKNLIDSQVALTDNQVNLTASQQEQVDAITSKVRAETDQIRGNTDFDTQQLILRRTAEEILQRSSSLFSDVSNKAQQYDVLKATVANIVKDTELKNFDVEAARAMGNVGRNLGQLKPIFDAFVSVLGLMKARSGGIVINR